MAHHQPGRNNARKAAARAVQRANPGMTYLQALAQVDEGVTHVDNPLDLASLLGVTSVQDIRDHHARLGLDLTVPVGLTESGDQVVVNIDAPYESPDAVGPHGIMTGPGSLTFALTVATALLARNGPASLQTVLVGSVHDMHATTAPVDHVLVREGAGRVASVRTPAAAAGSTTPAGTDWTDWIASELDRRGRLAADAGLRDLLQSRDVPRLIMILTEDGTYSHDERATIERIVRCGRSLGVHAIIVTEAVVAVSLSPAIMCNLGFHIALARYASHQPTATLHNESMPQEVCTFSPTIRVSEALTHWIGAARNQ